MSLAEPGQQINELQILEMRFCFKSGFERGFADCFECLLQVMAGELPRCSHPALGAPVADRFYRLQFREPHGVSAALREANDLLLCHTQLVLGAPTSVLVHVRARASR